MELLSRNDYPTLKNSVTRTTRRDKALSYLTLLQGNLNIKLKYLIRKILFINYLKIIE